MQAIALQIITGLLGMIDRELFVDVVDAIFDKVEARYHDDESIKAVAIMATCATARKVLDVPDDDTDQGNPV